MPFKLTCQKCGINCGHDGIQVLGEHPIFLCRDCDTDFSLWCRMMDGKFISYEYDEFLLEAA